MTGRTFVGFGFGPIQSALFLLEAYRSGKFARFVVAEVDGGLVKAVRENGGKYVVNVAHADRIERATVEGVEMYDPNVSEDRARLVQAVAEAGEIATALPSVRFFTVGGKASVASALAEGIAQRQGRAGVVYAAENHNHAAEILRADVAGLVGEDALVNVGFLNTVIGKMSGVIADGTTIGRMGLATMTPGGGKAVLVEAFNRILVSRVNVDYQRGIGVFEEKADLLPFEEAKLYGHNAIHALIGYLAHRKGMGTMAEACADAEILKTARRAFLYESGAALISKYQGLSDALFTPAGWRTYAEDLLVRMGNPNLNDLVVRVIRDAERKLGWDDRIFGTMRLVMGQGFLPKQLAKGAGAAAACLLAERGEKVTRVGMEKTLRGIWGTAADAGAGPLVEMAYRGMAELG